MFLINSSAEVVLNKWFYSFLTIIIKAEDSSNKSNQVAHTQTSANENQQQILYSIYLFRYSQHSLSISNNDFFSFEIHMSEEEKSYRISRLLDISSDII